MCLDCIYLKRLQCSQFFFGWPRAADARGVPHPSGLRVRVLTFLSFAPNFLIWPTDSIFLGLSSENSHVNNLAWLNGLQRGERSGNMRPNVIEIIRRRTDNQNKIFLPVMFC